MNCQQAARHLPGYLDGAVDTEVQDPLREHLIYCGPCRREVERYRVLSMALANLEPIEVPPEVALSIRVQASQGSCFQRAGTSVAMALKNIVGPLAFPATGGVLTALGVFVLLLQNLLMGVPRGGVVANDQPLNLVQPAALESLGPAPTLDAMDMDGPDGVVTLEATVNAEGQAVYYKIISGPSDPQMTRHIDQVLLLSRFRPLLSFGRPTDGGHVVLSFSAIHVRG